MPKIDFPLSPTIGQQYTEGGVTWEWTGSVWNLVCETTPLPETTYIGEDPIQVDVVTEPDGDKEITISHENSGVAAGTYNKVTVNVKGHVTSGTNEETTYIGEGPISIDEQVVVGGKEVTISHDNSTVTPGTYNKVTVDEKGHITAAENVDEQDNFVRVLRIPSSAINFNNDIKDEIVAYINQMDPPLVIDDTDSKWNIVIEGTIPGLLDSTTEINVWFDNSGSMNGVLEPIVNMVTSCLKDLLLPIYGDEATYDARVKVRSFTNFNTTVNGQSVSFVGKPDRNGQSADERTLYMLDTLGSSTEINRVINFVFQDEAQASAPPPEVYHKVPFDGLRTPAYDADVLALRTSINSISDPNYYYGVIYQLSAGTTTENAFKAFLQAITTGTGNFSGTNGISDFVTDGKIAVQYDLLKSTSPGYYLNLIRNTMISLGFVNVGSTESITCFQAITGQIVTSCSGSLGNVDVINVTGGSGSGYYFTLNGGVTQYIPGVGAAGLANGTYSVRIYDAAGNNYLLGSAVINCTTPLTGTATQSCLDSTGTNGKIDVTGVSGGSGSGYYFTLNGTGSYTPGTGVSGLTDGNYSVVLYDGAGTSVSLGVVTISCLQTYNINRYLCGTCTMIGTGAVTYNPSLPLVIGKFYILTNGEIAEITGLSTFSVTHTISDVLTYYDSCASAPCL